jgi:hypothetical protein
MTWAEAVDARGWTAVIIVSIGLSMESPQSKSVHADRHRGNYDVDAALGRLPTALKRRLGRSARSSRQRALCPISNGYS